MTWFYLLGAKKPNKKIQFKYKKRPGRTRVVLMIFSDSQPW
jgi:hypothetical protein